MTNKSSLNHGPLPGGGEFEYTWENDGIIQKNLTLSETSCSENVMGKVLV